LRAVIFANGRFAGTARERALVGSDDLLIAADGGARSCLALGLTPHVVVGDFDSLKPKEREALQQAGAQMIAHPARKDHTDLELALLHALQQGATDFLILGGLGQRWDQTLANLLLPANPAFTKVRITLVDGYQDVHLLTSGGTLTIDGKPGDILSLIPLSEYADGVRTEGLEYPLRDEALTFGSTRGVSNSLLGQQALIHLQQGLLLCVHIHSPSWLEES